MAADDPEAEANAREQREDIARAYAHGRRRRRARAIRGTLELVVAAIITAVLGAVTSHLAGSSGTHTPTPHPTATVTVTATPNATAAPEPTVTVTRYIVATGGGASDGWVAIAALGTAVAGIGTLLGGFAAVAAIRRRADDKRDSGTGPKAGAGA